jgi:integrase
LLTNRGDQTPTKITEELVKTTAVPAAGSTSIWDTDITGFGLRVYSKGTRSFFYDYRLNGRGKRISIGKYPAWNAARARIRAKELRQLVDKGGDPAGEKRERREAATMRDLAERFKNERGGERSRPDDEQRMVGEILHILGKDTKVASVHYGDMEEMHRKITNGYEGKKPRPVRANRILATASVMFTMSLRPLAGEDKAWRSPVDGNPCKGIKRNHEEESGRLYMPAEMAAIADALAEYPSEVAQDCVKLIMFTGCRPIEAKRALWPQFDKEPGFWNKPSSHTKQKKQHRVPLSPPALQLIEQLRAKRAKDSPAVFPGRTDDGTFDATQHVWRFVRERATVTLWAGSGDPKVAGLVADLRAAFGREPTAKECLDAAKLAEVELPIGLLGKTKETVARLYDCRHSFASHGAGGGLSLPIIGRLLGHASSKTTQRYAKHLADDPLQSATNMIAGKITGKPPRLVSGGQP